MNSKPALSQSQDDTISTDTIWLVYDGDCPFCSASAQTVRVKQAVGNLRILNAREAQGHPLMDEIRAQALDLNQGIVVKFAGQLYHGAEALHLLAMIGSEQGWLNRLNVRLFRNRSVVRFAYPVLKAMRGASLTLLGKTPI
jgi:predicted DCC family thiol-disulfide oxidoreductase YuxK